MKNSYLIFSSYLEHQYPCTDIECKVLNTVATVIPLGIEYGLFDVDLYQRTVSSNELLKKESLQKLLELFVVNRGCCLLIDIDFLSGHRTVDRFFLFRLTQIATLIRTEIPSLSSVVLSVSEVDSRYVSTLLSEIRTRYNKVKIKSVQKGSRHPCRA